ncbi:hypothetical protein ERJ75_001094900 [Trypanosoma vivax]|nr:hypothetical protein ERJ75_001094900 [Trypanosoma vivax]
MAVLCRVRARCRLRVASRHSVPRRLVVFLARTAGRSPAALVRARSQHASPTRPVAALGSCLLYVAARLRAFATLWALGLGEDWLSVRGFGCVGACEALAAAAHGMAGMACAFFFLLCRGWRSFSARGAFARMDMTRGAWLLALFLLAAATGEAAIDNKAGVNDTDAGLLCVVSGALKGGARQAQVDTARAFDLMSTIAKHRAGPDVAQGE